MDIEFDRRHVFYFDTDNNIRSISPYRLDRLWRGEPDAAMPELANQRVRFAILHIERFSSPLHVVIEHYPVLTFDSAGNLDLELQYAQLQADVDNLEANDYAPTPANVEPSETTWHPDTITRRRLIAATRPSYTTRHSRPTPHHGAPSTASGGPALSVAASPPPATRPHPRPATPPVSAPPRR